TESPSCETYTLSLHDALPIYQPRAERSNDPHRPGYAGRKAAAPVLAASGAHRGAGGPEAREGGEASGRVARAFQASGPLRTHARSEEHTSELQSRENLVCRLL